mmetsp:Transcript_32696/g.33034  ORF Transcript_32696/g.33034 Transcript_32696/m.33034 type:complete len:311 (-) Transcript_32696:1438-2370(-)
MKAKTQYTPRANFHESALTSIIKSTPAGYIPRNTKVMLYEGPDEHNICLDIPEDEIDVFNVVTGRRRLNKDDFHLPSRLDLSKFDGSARDTTSLLTRHLEGGITPGTGWEVWGEPPGLCDGTYNATCGRWTQNECLLYGHHDARGAVIGNEYSGWLVMTLKELKEGIIILKLHTWHTADESTITQGWKSVGNVRRRRRLGESLIHLNTSESFQRGYYETNEPTNRMLMRSYDTPKLPDQFSFEYSINGVVTSLTGDQFLKKKKQIQRVVETITILDDPNFTTEAKDVEIAIRLLGSGRSIVFGVSHVYWA